MNPRYRLLHKKDGTYVLQIELMYETEGGKLEAYWHDLETVEEEE
jgi:hypothetical protein